MTPELLSFEFHTRFFPALIRSRLRPNERAQTGFSSSVEKNFLFILCVIFFVIGIPSAILHKSVIGWTSGGIGAAGILVLIINSIFSSKDPPGYDNFLIGIFFFFVMLGMTAGVFAGSLNHSFALGLLVGTAGLIAGYLLGIGAGLWFQYLGWLASMVNGLAMLAVIGMFSVDLVLLAGSLF